MKNVESEFIAARGSKIEILGAETYSPSTGGKNNKEYYINIFVKLLN